MFRIGTIGSLRKIETFSLNNPVTILFLQNTYTKYLITFYRFKVVLYSKPSEMVATISFAKCNCYLRLGPRIGKRHSCGKLAKFEQSPATSE